MGEVGDFIFNHLVQEGDKENEKTEKISKGVGNRNGICCNVGV
jgi:hypothetical protein